MPLKPSTRLGPYEILAPLGAAGMSEVYRARDPRMGRELAIKVSAKRFSDRTSVILGNANTPSVLTRSTTTTSRAMVAQRSRRSSPSRRETLPRRQP